MWPAGLGEPERAQLRRTGCGKAYSYPGEARTGQAKHAAGYHSLLKNLPLSLSLLAGIIYKVKTPFLHETLLIGTDT
jgi:hypothetical protein